MIGWEHMKLIEELNFISLYTVYTSESPKMFHHILINFVLMLNTCLFNEISFIATYCSIDMNNIWS